MSADATDIDLDVPGNQQPERDQREFKARVEEHIKRLGRKLIRPLTAGTIRQSQPRRAITKDQHQHISGRYRY